MICVNALSKLKCNKRSVLENLVIALSPFAPHISEELWQILGHEESVILASYPQYNEAFIREKQHEYPIMINGKMRTKIKFDVNLPQKEIEKNVLDDEVVKKWLDGKSPKKIIIVPKRIINVVV